MLEPCRASGLILTVTGMPPQPLHIKPSSRLEEHMHANSLTHERRSAGCSALCLSAPSRLSPACVVWQLSLIRTHAPQLSLCIHSPPPQPAQGHPPHCQTIPTLSDVGSSGASFLHCGSILQSCSQLSQHGEMDVFAWVTV